MRILLSEKAATDLGVIIGDLAQAGINMRHNDAVEIATTVLRTALPILLSVYDENNRVAVEHREAVATRLAEINETMLDGCIQLTHMSQMQR